MSNKKMKANIVYILVFLIVVVVLLLFIMNMTVGNIKKAEDSAIEQNKETQFETVWCYLETLSLIADNEAFEVASSIESDISNTFDLDSLEVSMNKNAAGEYPKELRKIIQNNTSNHYFGNIIHNNRNAMMVIEGAENNIVEDYFLDAKSREPDKPSIPTSHVKLNDYLETTYNAALFKSALKKIRTRSDVPMALEPYNYLDEDHMMISEVTYDNLKKVFMKEGLKGLRNYQFFAPAYITETGDIFGNKDIIAGVPQPTHKLVVIQFFNLYDQFMHIDADFDDPAIYKEIQLKYQHMLTYTYILGFSACAIVLVCIIFCMAIFNNLIDIEDEEERKRSEKELTTR